VGLVTARRYDLDWKAALDCATPAVALAQAVGRWGNYFNQELYGWKSGLPWAVKIDHPQVAGRTYAPGTTFQPTFLYECLWDLCVVGLVIWVERRFRIKRGYLIAAYASFYTFGRFFTEYMRIDDAHRWLGLRLNDWTSIVVFVVSLIVLSIWGRAGEDDDRAGTPMTKVSQPPDPTSVAAGGLPT
jgi:prolipoprotein diacylglyceryl transferase